MSSTTSVQLAKNMQKHFKQLFLIPPVSILIILILCSFLNSIAYVRSFIDDTGYHIPMAVEIARHHNPYYVDTHSSFTSFWFPAGAESLVAAIVAFTHDINSTNVSGSVFFVLFLWLSYNFAGIWTDDFKVRLLCVILTGIIPVLFAQTRAFYVDIHLNFLVYLSLYLYGLSVVKEDANYSYLGVGVAILAASVKYQGLVFCAILIPVGIGCALTRQKRNLSWVVLGCGLLCVSFTSGWYIRNLLLKGNPIYPLALPQSLQTVAKAVGLPYQGIDFPNLSPQAQLPYPLIPKTLSHYDFRPDITNNAFGLGFPISLAMLTLVGLFSHRMNVAQRQVFLLTLATSIAVIVVLPFHLSVPRYILFIPAVAGLWPSCVAACTGRRRESYFLIYSIVLLLSSTYIQANLIDGGDRKTIVQNAITLLAEGRDSSIVHFDLIDQGNLRIGYLSGRFAFIASLYDRKLTNQLIQLHYRDYFLDRGAGFTSSNEFVNYIRSLDLDYICIFDTKAPGAQIIKTNFPAKTFVEDKFK